MAGFTMGQADVLRNAMSKKIRDVMVKQKDLFIEGAKKNGISEDGANRIWEQIEPFAGYAFNKAHAACYALLAYQTAYLKTHYPVEYMTALSTSYVADTDKIALTLGECRRLGVAVLPPGHQPERAPVQRRAVPAAGSPLKPVNGSRGPAGHAIRVDRRQGCWAREPSRAWSRSGRRTARSDPVGLLPPRGHASDQQAGGGEPDQVRALWTASGREPDLMHRLDQTMDAAQQEQRAQEVGQITMFDAMFEMPVSHAASASGDFGRSRCPP